MPLSLYGMDPAPTRATQTLSGRGEDLADSAEKFLRGKWLQKQMMALHFTGMARQHAVGVAGNEQGRQARTDLAKLPNKLRTGAARHHDVANHQFNALAKRLGERQRGARMLGGE